MDQAATHARPSSPSAVTAITSAFGDPTRREIYLFAREHDRRASPPSEVAEQFDLHPNVARHHLDKLAGGGYLEVEVARAERRRRRSAVQALPGHRRRRPSLEFAVRHDDLLVTPARPGAGPAPPRRRPRPWPKRSASSTAALMAAVAWATPTRRGRPALVPRRAARRGRRAHRPRLRRPRREARQRAAHRERALPLRRRRHRAPGDLRRRPGHGQGHARRALRRHHARDRVVDAPWATTSASPPSKPDPRVMARHYLDHASTSPLRPRRPRPWSTCSRAAASTGWCRPTRAASTAEGMAARVGARGGPRRRWPTCSAPGRARSCSPAAPPRPSPRLARCGAPADARRTPPGGAGRGRALGGAPVERGFADALGAR